MTDLVEALQHHEMPPLAHDAADEITRLKASNAELVEALKRLADETEGVMRGMFGSGPPNDRIEDMPVLRQARAAIEKAAGS